MNSVKEDFNASVKETNELLKVIAEKLTGSETSIRKNAEEVGKLADTPAILQELGKRMEDQDKHVEELKGGVGEMKAGLEKMREKISIPVETISQLRTDLKNHVEFFSQPRQKNVHHRHFLGKPILALALAMMVITVLVVLLTQSYTRAGEQAAGDIQWRYAKLSLDSVFMKTLLKTEELYKANPQQFSRDVIEEEDRRQKLFEKWNLQDETQKEIKDLEERKKLK
jgi:uncharacterized coiled-coil protein SlyX